MYIYIYAYIHKSIYVYIHVYIYIHICVYTYFYVYTYIYKYIYICICSYLDVFVDCFATNLKGFLPQHSLTKTGSLASALNASVHGRRATPLALSTAPKSQ